MATVAVVFVGRATTGMEMEVLRLMLAAETAMVRAKRRARRLVRENMFALVRASEGG